MLTISCWKTLKKSRLPKRPLLPVSLPKMLKESQHRDLGCSGRNKIDRHSRTFYNRELKISKNQVHCFLQNHWFNENLIGFNKFNGFHFRNRVLVKYFSPSLNMHQICDTAISLEPTTNSQLLRLCTAKGCDTGFSRKVEGLMSF